MNNKALFYALTLVAACAFTGCEDLYVGRIVDNAAVPRITTQPQGINYVQDEDIAVPMSVAVEPGDAGQLSYQWYRNDVNSYEGGRAVLNATQSSYKPSPDNDVAYYWVVVTNTNNTVIGSKTSSVRSEIVAVRAVDEIVNAAAPVITAQPQGAAYNPGVAPVALSVTAAISDGGRLSYQWYSNSENDYEGGAPVDGGTEAEYTPVIPAEVTAEEVTYYWVVVTNTNDDATGVKTVQVTSDRAGVTVTSSPLVNAAPPVITAQPRGAPYNPGAAPAALSVTAETGDGGRLSYQWYSNSEDSYEGGAPVSGGTEAEYTPVIPAEVTADEVTYYWVVVTNTNDDATGVKTAEVKSGRAAVTVQAGEEIVNASVPVITAQPQGAVYDPGDTPAALSVTAEITGNGQLSYQWYSNSTDSYAYGAPVSGGTEAEYTPVIPAEVTADEVTYYWVVVTNTNDDATGIKTAQATSYKAAITVVFIPLVHAEAPVITAGPADAEYEEGQTITALSVTATIGDGGTASYQWYKNSQDDFETAEAISGAVSQTYTPPAPSGLTETQTTYYWVKVTNTNNTVTGVKTAFAVSGSAAITVKPYPALPLMYEVTGGAFKGTYASGESFTATLGGSAAAVAGTTPAGAGNGMQVINTGNSGYIDLGDVVGKALMRLETWTLEMYIYVPTAFEYSGDGPHVFAFGKPSGPAVFTPIKDLRFRISPNNAGTWSTNVEYTNGYDGYWPEIRGSWKHLVFTLGPDSEGRSELSVYENGRLAMYGPVEAAAMANRYKTTGLDLLGYGYLGRSGSWITAGNTIANAQFYRFNVYEGAKQPGEILGGNELAQTLTALNGAGEQITGFDFTPTAGLTEGESSAAPGGVAGSFAAMRGGIGDFTYTLVAGEGDTHNGQFTIAGKELKVAGTALTFGNKSVRVRATDAAGATLEKTCGFRVGKDFGALKLWYDFASANVSDTAVEDATGLHTGTLQGGATVSTENGVPVLSLPNSGSPWFDLGESAGGFFNSEDGFTVSTYIFVDSSFSFGSGDGDSCPWVFCGKEYYNSDAWLVCMTFKGTQVEVDTGGPSGTARDWNGIWTSDFSDLKLASLKGQWHHIVYTLKGTNGELWYDGVKAKTKENTNNQAAFGATTFNTLGKPWKSGRAYMKNTKYAGFRIYNKVLSAEEIAELNNSDTLKALKGN